MAQYFINCLKLRNLSCNMPEQVVSSCVLLLLLQPLLLLRLLVVTLSLPKFPECTFQMPLLIKLTTKNFNRKKKMLEINQIFFTYKRF